MARTLLLLAGWVVFAGLAYKVATSEAVQTAVYNPFEILGISEVGPPDPPHAPHRELTELILALAMQSLTDKEIKRAYKKLSLKLSVPAPLAPPFGGCG
jgi:preprotein translocase subunit Sec63